MRGISPASASRCIRPAGAEPEAFLQSGAQADDSEVAEIEALIQQRLDARKAKDWAAADAARDRLNEMGIVLEDGPKGTTWRRK